MKHPIRFTASRKVESAEFSPRRLSIEAYTGGAMSVSGWGLIVVDLVGLELPESIPVLADHENVLGSVIGSGVPSINDNSLTVEATLVDTPAAGAVLKLLEGGVALQASVGADPVQHRAIREGESVSVNGKTLKGPFTLISKSKLREVSITPIGADSTTSVIITAKRMQQMSFEEYILSLDLVLEDLSAEVVEALRKAYELATSEETDEDETEAESLPATAAAVVELLSSTAPSLCARAVRERWDLPRANREALNHIRANRPTGPTIVRGSQPTSMQAFEAGLMVKAGFESAAAKAYGEQAAERGRILAQRSLVDMCAESLRLRGRDVPSNRSDMIRAAVSSGDLTTSLGNTANKIAETVWREAPATWRSFAAIRSANNFKNHTSLRPSFAGDLAPLPSGGSIDHGSLGEETISWKVASFAKIYVIDRQTIVDDDASVLSELVPGLARAAGRTLANLVYATLLGGASTHFTVGRANTQSGGSSALSAASLRVAVQQMRLMEDPDGSPINMTPAVLLVPPDLELTARELLNSAELYRDGSADRQPAGNAFQGLAKLEVEPRLSSGCTHPTSGDAQSGSATAWFLLASPADMPLIVGFLNDRQFPTIESFGLSADPNRLAMSFRCYHDFGCSLGDFRAGQRSAGA